LPKASVLINGERVNVDIATTEASRQQGLSGRQSIGPNNGMLFIFESTGRPGIWMKDMRFAIDIVWLDDTWLVVDSTKNAAPASYPEIFETKMDARYVLELPAGWLDRHNVKLLDHVLLIP
jgi:hypothetical protein